MISKFELHQICLGMALVAAACLGGSAFAQVRCTMPNGIVIEQQLSDTCPAGARKAEGADGSPAKIQGPKLAPPSPIITDKRMRRTQEIRREELGSDWPLTAAGGTLSCMYPVNGRLDMPALLITVDGNTFGINGTADGHAAHFGWSNIRQIWRDHPTIIGTKIPITALLQRAAAVCK